MPNSLHEVDWSEIKRGDRVWLMMSRKMWKRIYKRECRKSVVIGEYIGAFSRRRIKFSPLHDYEEFTVDRDRVRPYVTARQATSLLLEKYP